MKGYLRYVFIGIALAVGVMLGLALWNFITSII